MGDTIPAISWTLHRPCPLRRQDDLVDPVKARRRLGLVQHCADAMIVGDDIVDGFWVSRTHSRSDAAGNEITIPHGGKRLEDVALPLGGWDKIHAECGSCEANVAGWSGGSVAGCQGAFYLPYVPADRLAASFAETIRRRGLEERLRTHFPPTNPLWYSFWIESPLRRPQCELLLELLPRALSRLACEDESEEQPDSVDLANFSFGQLDHRDYHGKQFREFFAALKAAIEWNLRLRVTLAPPGHGDFGWLTIFPHCPRCKVWATRREGRNRGEGEAHRCEVCGHQFDLQRTARSEKMNMDWDASSLESQLGDQYDAFAVRYAEAKGWTARQMEEALERTHDWQRIRDVERRRKRVRRLEQRFAKEADLAAAGPLPPARTLEIAPGVSLELTLIPAGKFWMGSTSDASEQPVRQVVFTRPFYLGKYPITQEQWTAVMENNPSRNHGAANLPVDQATWLDAQDFCGKLSERLERHFRLPSEAEWEYACRAGTTSRYWWGDAISADDANFAYNGRRPETPATTVEGGPLWRKTTPVDFFPPNPWGLCDMLGNVLEWCQDSWHDSYEAAPCDGSAWIDASEGAHHVARGGGRYGRALDCQSAWRGRAAADRGVTPKVSPEEAANAYFPPAESRQAEYFGFRVVCWPLKLDQSAGEA
ncbi:formylglycine-generating enzyme family protein [Blastopirellula marina]|uniref:Sulfatase-modifying factor enzyme-like domain-containing protein n=1 Tax=Blastopirellula marina TaxID=124 RepID=A0A2S8GHF0_9BACT|nr:formylglycine-generating enzyme family protein [Blastopirellula marina]PQO43434.1 hypothetical protein C5Y98_00540 [Blastopirellula marina]PTL46748.1 formylglycine-generating enzyme family protein [Blastopirellula marina]